MGSDRSRADHVDSAAISALVKNEIVHQSNQPAANDSIRLQMAQRAAHQVDYRVADLFGRCFLRVCLLVDLIYSWKRQRSPIGVAPPIFSSQRAAAEVMVAAAALERTGVTTASLPRG